jgi:hypothetical protein
MPSSSHNGASPGILCVNKIPYTRAAVAIPKIAPPSAFLSKLRALRHKHQSMSKKKLFKVVFMCQGQVYEIYARNVGHGELFGFVEIEELVFGERTTVVVDPSEEKIKTEFENVKRTYLPMHAVIRIDEVDKQGISKISKLEGGNIAQFPMPVYTPRDKG